MANYKDVFYIKPAPEDGKGKAFWMRIGRAFVNKDGSTNVKLDVPVIPGMDIQIREHVEKESFE